MPKGTPRDPVTAFAAAVIARKVIVGRLARLACARHLADLAAPTARGLVWRPDDAQEVIDFFATILCLPEESDAGETVEDDADADTPPDGTPFVLSPWQAFNVGSVIGWWTTQGRRRFRVWYLETAKGQGKTPLAVGVLLFLLIVDGDRGAQFFVAAVGKAQAKIAFADAEKMVAASPALRDLIETTLNNLAVPGTGSFLRAISSEKRGLDGKRVSGALIDELHEATAIVVNKIRKGTKGRRNALIIETTNSGFDRTSICWVHHAYSVKVLEGTVQDDAWFAYICGLDPCDACLAKGLEFPDEKCAACDDWKTEGPHWLKASPNLGVSVSWQYLRELVRVARVMPSEVSDVLRFNFCVWTQGQSRFLDMVKWAACGPFPSEAELVGARCYAGLDLGQTDDLCAFVLLWVLRDGRHAVKARFWLPQAALEKYPHRPYDAWQRAQVLEVTEGDDTDYTVVEAAVGADCLAAGVIECAYDKRFAHQMAQNLQGLGITMVDTPQGFQLNEALRKVNSLVVSGALCHGDNPILTVMASNAVVRHGRNKEIRLDKEKAADKIDGISALTMAEACVIAHQPEGTSKYETDEMAAV